MTRDVISGEVPQRSREGDGGSLSHAGDRKIDISTKKLPALLKVLNTVPASLN